MPRITAVATDTGGTRRTDPLACATRGNQLVPAPTAAVRRVPGWRRGPGALVGAAVAAALLASAVQAPPPAHAAVPKVNVAAAAVQCDTGLTGYSRGARGAAEQLMAGRVDLDEYGRFRLKRDPRWRPVSTLDSSGNGHMHSLHYLMPLLRYGQRTGNQAMVSRFYELVRDWVRDNPPGGPSSRYAWGPPIYEGFRSLVLVCAAARSKATRPWLARALLRHGQMMADAGRYEGVNNASLHQSMGLYAIGETIRRPAWRALATRRIAALAARLIRSDGSDGEGALEYAVNNYRWFGQAGERLRLGGDPVPAELRRLERVPAFIAQATRPDGRVEALGDTSPEPLVPRRWAGTAAEYPATLGASGAPPAQTFAAYEGGYVFGRSGWGTKRKLADETFFSVRAGWATPHAHDDAGSLTLYSHGSQLLLDTGQWRYSYGTTRSFVVSRAAHNVVVVHGARRTRPVPELRAVSVGGLDIATVVDRGYDGVTLTRTVAYDRADDVLLVWDRLESQKEVRASQQWGLGRDRSVSVRADAAHTAGPGADVSLLFTSGGAPLDVAVGQRKPLRGWNSQAYGEISPAPSLRATQKGTSLSWLTVIAPRAEDVPPSEVSATAAVSLSGASVALSAPGGSATVALDAAGGSRSEYASVPAAVKPEAPIVLSGTTTTLRATGLQPERPARLERLTPGESAWTAVGEATASEAGTAEFRVPAPATAEYRAVSGPAVSVPQRVVAAFPPAPVPSVVAAPSGPGRVAVSWQHPADTGGAPLTGYAVRMNGERSRLGAGATSTEVRGVVAGPGTVRVRAANAVAFSPWSTMPVDVPAYPSISGPRAVRKGTLVTLDLGGLLPRARAAVTFDPVKGRTLTKRPRARADGTVTVRFRVKHRATVVATSGGVDSRPHRVRPR